MNRASSGDRCIMVGWTAFSRSISRETTATVLSDLIVSSLAAFEACAVNSNTRFSVPDAAAGKRGIHGTQCNVARMSGANCRKTVNKTYCLPAWTDVLVMHLAELVYWNGHNLFVHQLLVVYL